MKKEAAILKIVEREVSCVITIRTAVENLMLSSLYKVFVGRRCGTPTNHSCESPLNDHITVHCEGFV